MSATSAQKMPLSQKVGFVGGGQMALALAKGFIAAKLIASEQILVSAPSDRNLKTWRDDMNCRTTHDNAEVIKECDIVFLSTKVDRDIGIPQFYIALFFENNQNMYVGKLGNSFQKSEYSFHEMMSQNMYYPVTYK